MAEPARLSLFADHYAETAARHITPQEVRRMAERPSIGPKQKAALIVPFESNGKTKEHARDAMYAAVVIDHDNDNKTEADIRHLYGPGGLNVCYLAFTTSSHTLEAQRWKVVVPFALPVDADSAAKISVGIAYSLCTDEAQARKQQGFYAPNKLTQDAPYEAIVDCLGEPWQWLQPDDAESLFIQEAVQGWQEYLAELERKTAAAKPKPRPVQLDSASAGIVERIQAAYDLAHLLEQHGYKRKGSGLYLSPFSSSGAAGVKVLTGGHKPVVYSHHGPDCPLSHHNHGGHALDVADVLCALRYGGDFAAMIRAEALELDSAGNKQRQREYMQAKEAQRVAEAFYSTDEPAQNQQGTAGFWEGVDIPDQASQEQPDGTPAQANEPVRIHPLTRFVELGRQPEPPRWLVPGFIAEGVVMIAGGHGAGKTTALLPLAMAVAGIHPPEYELKPEHWRHVVYITEDIHQAARIVAGYTDWLDWPPGERGTWDKVQSRLHIVEARRGTPELVTEAGPYYRDTFTRTVTTTGLDGVTRTVELAPLVVIDTIAATVHLENENDNSEASAAVAMFKQRFAGLPLWFVGHTAKANLNRSELTARGASAWEADANQVLYLVDEDTKGRWLVRGKTRFESPWQELEIQGHSTTIAVPNRFGAEESLTLRWSIATPAEQDRKQRQEQAQADRVERDREAMRQSILDAVQAAYDEGQRLNRNGVCAQIQGRKQNALDAINALLSEGWLFEVEIPRNERLNSKRPNFLVVLTPEERTEYLKSGAVPEAKQIIPASWKKQPEPEQEAGE